MVARAKRIGIGGVACAALLLAALGATAAPTPSRVALPLHRTPPLPPPFWPVDGHHHAHPSGALLRFDSGLGVYAVSGASGVFYFADAFIRLRDGLWEFSPRPTGPWSPGRAEWVPFTLRVGLYPGP